MKKKRIVFDEGTSVFWQLFDAVIWCVKAVLMVCAVMFLVFVVDMVFFGTPSMRECREGVARSVCEERGFEYVEDSGWGSEYFKCFDGGSRQELKLKFSPSELEGCR